MSGRSRYRPRNQREPLERLLYGDERDLYRERDMSPELRAYLARGGLLLRPGTPRQLGGKRLVRNQTTGDVLLCCHGPCDQSGDDRIRIAVPHQQPRWFGEKLIYIFCSELCRRSFAVGTPYERYL